MNSGVHLKQSEKIVFFNGGIWMLQRTALFALERNRLKVFIALPAISEKSECSAAGKIDAFDTQHFL